MPKITADVVRRHFFFKRPLTTAVTYRLELFLQVHLAVTGILHSEGFLLPTEAGGHVKSVNVPSEHENMALHISQDAARVHRRSVTVPLTPGAIFVRKIRGPNKARDRMNDGSAYPSQSCHVGAPLSTTQQHRPARRMQPPSSHLHHLKCHINVPLLSSRSIAALWT